MAMNFDKGSSKIKSQKRAAQVSAMAHGTWVQKINVDLIDESPLNEGIPVDDFQAIAKTIEEVGLESPLTVYDLKNGRYEVYSGHQRLLAVKSLGWTSVDCIVKEYTADAEKRFKEHLYANRQRELDSRFWIAELKHAKNLLDTEYGDGAKVKKAEYYQKLQDLLGISDAQIRRFERMENLTEEMRSLETIGISPLVFVEAFNLSDDKQKILADYVKQKVDQDGEGAVSRAAFHAALVNVRNDLAPDYKSQEDISEERTEPTDDMNAPTEEGADIDSLLNPSSDNLDDLLIESDIEDTDLSGDLLNPTESEPITKEDKNKAKFDHASSSYQAAIDTAIRKAVSEEEKRIIMTSLVAMRDYISQSLGKLT